MKISPNKPYIISIRLDDKMYNFLLARSIENNIKISQYIYLTIKSFMYAYKTED